MTPKRAVLGLIVAMTAAGCAKGPTAAAELSGSQSAPTAHSVAEAPPLPSTSPTFRTSPAGTQPAATITFAEVEWDGQLPRTHPSRFVADYAGGIGLFSASTGRLQRMLLEAGAHHPGCTYSIREVLPDGSLLVHSIPKARVCSELGVFPWDPERGAGALAEEGGVGPVDEVTLGDRSVRVSTDKSETVIAWSKRGEAPRESRIEGAAFGPALNRDGLLALAGYDQELASSYIAILPWSGQSADIQRLAPPGGAACVLHAPGWLTAPDSTGNETELLTAVEQCPATTFHPKADDTSVRHRMVVLDAARGELLDSSLFPASDSEFGLTSGEWWNGTLLYQPEAGDGTGPVAIFRGGERVVLDTRHPTAKNDCSSADPVRPCASNAHWVPDTWD